MKMIRTLATAAIVGAALSLAACDSAAENQVEDEAEGEEIKDNMDAFPQLDALLQGPEPGAGVIRRPFAFSGSRNLLLMA